MYAQDGSSVSRPPHVSELMRAVFEGFGTFGDYVHADSASDSNASRFQR